VYVTNAQYVYLMLRLSALSFSGKESDDMGDFDGRIGCSHRERAQLEKRFEMTPLPKTK
jgi:hypothetical protein